MDAEIPVPPATPPLPPVTEEITAPIPPLPKNNSLLAKFLLVALIAVFLAGGGYFLGTRTTTPRPTPSPIVNPTATPDPTVDWKTYTSTKYNFILKYPDGWEFEPCTDLLCGTFFENNKEVVRLEGVSSGCGLGIFTPTQEYAEKFSMCSCDASMPGVAGMPGIDTTCNSPSGEKVTTNQNGIKVYSFLLDELKNNTFQRKRGPYFTIFFSKPILSGGVLYEYGLYFEVLDNNKISEFDQILSTFKFINQNEIDTSNWKTYTNSAYSFSFKYPPTWHSNSDQAFPDAIFFSPKEITFLPASEGPITPITVLIKQDTEIQKEVIDFRNMYQYKDYKEEAITVADINATKISGVVSAESYITGKLNIEVLIPKSRNIVEFSYIDTGETTINTFDQILSTFKFL